MVVENLEGELDPMIARIAPTRQLARGKVPALRRPNPALAVVGWELRRVFASPAMWLTAVAVFGAFALVMAARAFRSTWGFGDGVVNLQADIPYGSAMRLFYDLPFDLLFPLVLVVIFLVADGAARDWHRRTHELVMATALPTWAYIWGRYLVVTVLSLFFAVELLLAILLLVTIEHATIGGANYPAAQLGPVLATWAALVLPTTVFAGGLGFALSSLTFRATTLVKLAVSLGWFIWLSALPAITRGNPDVPQWLLRWDPTYVGLAHTGLYDIYDRAFWDSVVPLERSGQAVSQGQLLHLFHQLVYALPDSGSWLPPHIVWAVGTMALVLWVSLRFRRYQDATR